MWRGCCTTDLEVPAGKRSYITSTNLSVSVCRVLRTCPLAAGKKSCNIKKSDCTWQASSTLLSTKTDVFETLLRLFASIVMAISEMPLLCTMALGLLKGPKSSPDWSCQCWTQIHHQIQHSPSPSFLVGLYWDKKLVCHWTADLAMILQSVWTDTDFLTGLMILGDLHETWLTLYLLE